MNNEKELAENSSQNCIDWSEDEMLDSYTAFHQAFSYFVLDMELKCLEKLKIAIKDTKHIGTINMQLKDYQMIQDDPKAESLIIKKYYGNVFLS